MNKYNKYLTRIDDFLQIYEVPVQANALIELLPIVLVAVLVLRGGHRHAKGVIVVDLQHIRTEGGRYVCETNPYTPQVVFEEVLVPVGLFIGFPDHAFTHENAVKVLVAVYEITTIIVRIPEVVVLEEGFSEFVVHFYT
jgi:hypothetical protein